MNPSSEPNTGLPSAQPLSVPKTGRERTFIISLEGSKNTQDKKVESSAVSSSSLSNKNKKMSQTQFLKSYYCSEKFKKGGFCKNLNSSLSSLTLTDKPSKMSETPPYKGDIRFLKTLLAMSKKQELLIHKKLVKILTEEEFTLDENEKHLNSFGRNRLSGRWQSHSSMSSYLDTGRGMSRKGVFHERKSEPRTYKNGSTDIARTSNFPQYDYNGRRIFTEHLNEEDNDVFFDCEKIPAVKSGASLEVQPSTKPAPKSQRTVKSKSMTFEEDSKESKPNKRRVKKYLLSIPEGLTKSEAKLSKTGSQGLSVGIQNMVVHCNEVNIGDFQDKRTNKVVKVWNNNGFAKSKAVSSKASDDTDFDKKNSGDQASKDNKISKAKASEIKAMTNDLSSIVNIK